MENEIPNALQVAEYQYCTTAYDFKIHAEADKTIQVILKQLYRAALEEAATICEGKHDYMCSRAAEQIKRIGIVI